MDCEDGVAANMKDAARATIARMLDGKTVCRVIIRISLQHSKDTILIFTWWPSQPANSNLILQRICRAVEKSVSLCLHHLLNNGICNGRSALSCSCNPADPYFIADAELAVRINPVSSGLAADDLAAVLSAKRLPNALVVPKVEYPDDIHWVMDRVRQLLGKHTERQQHNSSRHEENGNGSSGGLQQPIALVTMCESANALLNLRYAGVLAAVQQ